jgi:hypothetical protein
MKKLFLLGFFAGVGDIASAVPHEMYLASPKKIKVVGEIVKLTFELPCSNKNPDEWAGNLIAVSNDSGDRAMALGVVLSKDSCEAGPVKNFTFTYPLAKTGLTAEDLTEESGGSFEPIDIAR